MDDIIINQIKKYSLDNSEQKINAIREVLQEITLFALSKSDFFDKAAFCGGTALRIFYGLDRASEDLDFTLIKQDNSFQLENYFGVIKQCFAKFGLDIDISSKKDVGAFKSAFIKDNTIIHNINIAMENDYFKDVDLRISIKVNIEIDTCPPEGAKYEYKYGLFPSPFRILLLTKESLFSGKLHALICRNWVKGRDYYDYLFYLGNNVKPNIKYLENAIKQVDKKTENLDISSIKKRLIDRFNEVDFNEAKKDCIQFINDKSKLDLWSKEFFIGVTDQLLK